MSRSKLALLVVVALASLGPLRVLAQEVDGRLDPWGHSDPGYPPPPATAPAPETLHAPRIMYWWGKVNQHVDTATGAWTTDPDGSSGADIDMLTYCRRWYPATVAVRPFASETIGTWRAAGNVGAYTSTQDSMECVQPFVPRIMYWYGKVNQHVEPAGVLGAEVPDRSAARRADGRDRSVEPRFASGRWQTDPDGVSGADIDMLTYCRRWYPSTRLVVPFARETISTWRERGNLGAHTAEQTSYWCMP